MGDTKAKTWSELQLKAIDTRGRGIIVSAAAGSGKTAVLVERIIQLVTDAKNPIDLDQFLVVTFTNAAAYEMKTRIAEALAEKMETNPENALLYRQSLMINKANIMTLHAFCMAVVREHFNLVGVDPNFRIADETEVEMVKMEMLEVLFENYYATHSTFPILLESYERGLGDDNLKALVLDLYTFSRSVPEPDKWLEGAATAFCLPDGEGLPDAVVCAVLEALSQEASDLIEIAEKGLVLTRHPEGPAAYQAAFLSDMEFLERLRSMKSYTMAYEAIGSYAFPKLKSSREGDVRLKEKAQSFRDEVKKGIQDFRDQFFYKDEQALADDIKSCYPVIQALCDVVSGFAAAYTAAKADRGILDFNDLEQLCLQILCDKQGHPTEAAKEYQERFEEILTDEYQDINLVQETILSVLSRPNGINRFMVGDVKQSIYQFRLARPKLFLDKLKDFARPDSPNMAVHLNKNYRSRGNILTGINFIFSQLMSESLSGIAYDRDAALYSGRTYPNEDESIECLLVERTKLDDEHEENDEANELATAQLEIRAIAQRIKAIIDGDTMVTDAKTGVIRSSQFSDIVILSRTASTVAALYAQELMNFGIPAYCDEQGGFFESIELKVMTALLSIIDNPRQDIPFIAICRAPFVDLDNDALIEIRSAGTTEYSFYDCACAYTQYYPDTILAGKLQELFLRLNKYRQIASYKPIDELIAWLYTDTGYFDTVGLMPGGKTRQNNLRSFIEHAIKFEETSYSGLFHFIQYIDKIKKSGKLGVGQAKSLSANENVVRIMTIHKSKGLEFPIVFVSGLSKRFNLRDLSRSVLFDQSMGIGPDCIDFQKRTVSKTIQKALMMRKLKQDSLAEELRILYVAMTRAEEKLILVGSVEGLERRTRLWADFLDTDKKQIASYYMLRRNSVLDWIMPALIRHPDLADFAAAFDELPGINQLPYMDCRFKLTVFRRDDFLLASGQNDQSVQMRKDAFQQLLHQTTDENIKQQVRRRLLFTYPYKSLAQVPSKVSIAEIKSRYQKQLLQDTQQIEVKQEGPIFEPPEWIKQGAKKVSGAQLGAAVHRVMAGLDFSTKNPALHVADTIASLTNANILQQNEAESIDQEKMIRFLESSLCRRIQKSPQVYKEMPFVVDLPPSEIGIQGLPDDETILIHGIIDCFFEEPDGFIILDYKTDYIKSDVEEVAKRYQTQIQIYRKAVETVTGKKVTEAYLYFFDTGDIYAVKTK